MSWHDALSKRQSRDCLRSYAKPATDFETSARLAGMQKSKQIPIKAFQQLPCDGRDLGNARPPREADAAPVMDSTTTNSEKGRPSSHPTCA